MESEPIDIYTPDDINSILENGIICGDIIIRGENLKQLHGVLKINGSFGISDSDIESLGELKEISGDFWTSFYNVNSPLKSLNNLEIIKGDVTLRYSNVADLGELKHVGGRLSLRDTKIENLGKLKFVGGDLFLPKRLKDEIDLTDIKVVGNIKFWNDNKNQTVIIDKSSLGFFDSNVEVPYWGNQYIMSKSDLILGTLQQKDFYQYFKESFFENKFIDLKGNDNYAFVLYFDLLEELNRKMDLNVLIDSFENIKKYYPKVGGYISEKIIEEYENKKDYEKAWFYLRENKYISVTSVWDYEQKLSRHLLDGHLIAEIGGYSHLTDFGRNNIDSIKQIVVDYLSGYESKYNSSFFELFFDHGKLYKDLNNGYDPFYYKRFYKKEEEFYFYKKIDDDQLSMYNPEVIRHVVEKAILNQFRFILKESEDLYREKIGMPKIGEGWISETELFYKLADRFKKYEVLHHGKPSWIGRQHFDIYFPELNIAIEYQGQQHYQPIDYFGGVEAFKKNQERDENKRKLCLENNCILIYVEENYVFEELVLQIENNIKQNKNNFQ